MTANGDQERRRAAIFRAETRRHAVEALEYLLYVIRDENETTANRIKCATLIIEHGHGKPATIVVQDDFSAPTPEELLQKQRELTERMKSLVTKTGE